MKIIPQNGNSSSVHLAKIHRRLHMHFRFSNIGLLPDTVFLDVGIKEGLARRICVPGTPVFDNQQAVLAGLFPDLEKQGLINVSCDGTWVQASTGSDFYIVNFCFIPKAEVDEYLAVRHDIKRSRQAFEELTSVPWKASFFRNKPGTYDLACFPARPRKDQEHLLTVRNDHLGLY